jgi:outer membrane protein
MLIGSLIFAHPVWSQTPGAPSTGANALSLKQAIAVALEKHPVIEAATHALRAGEARTEQARSSLYPQVGASAIETSGSLRANAFLRPSGSLIQPNQTDITPGVTVSQLLYDFGQTAHRIAANRLAAQALSDDVLTHKAGVILNVQQAYDEGLKRQRLVQIAEETVREREVIQRQVDSLFRQQLKAKLDLDLVQVELSKAGVDLIRARNDLKASYAALNRAMGVTGPGAYALEDTPVTVSAVPPLESLLATSLDKRPEMLAVRERIRAAEQRIKAAQSQNFPTIQAVGSAGDTEQLAGRSNVREGGWWGAGVAVSVPLFTGFLIQNQVREAEEQHQEAQSNARDIEQAIRLEVTNAVLTLETLAQQIKAIEVLVNQTQEALQLAQERYRLGLSSIVEVTQGEVAVTTAQTQLAEAQYDYKTAEAALGYAVGEGYQGY